MREYRLRVEFYRSPLKTGRKPRTITSLAAGAIAEHLLVELSSRFSDAKYRLVAIRNRVQFRSYLWH